MNTRAPLATLALASLLSPAAAQDLVLGVNAKPGDAFGWAVTIVPDVDGDGWQDVAVGSPFADLPGKRDCGLVEIYSGRSGAQLRRFAGLYEGEAFGFSLDYASDLDSDGDPELVVGAPFHDVGPYEAAGRVYVLSYDSPAGQSGPIDGFVDGDVTGALLGFAVTGVEARLGQSAYFAAGAPAADDVGRVQVHYYAGGTYPMLWELSGERRLDRFGWSLDDCQGSDLPCLIVGAPTADDGFPESGAAYLVVTDYIHHDPHIVRAWTGSSYGEWFGRSVQAAGFYDGGDAVSGFYFAIGAPYRAGLKKASGAVDVYAAPDFGKLAQTLWGAPGEGFGSSLSQLADLDADGEPEVAVGGPLLNADSGAASVWNGKKGLPLDLVPGLTPQSQLGASVCGEGDIDGDGRADLVVGVPLFDGNGTDAGRVEVYFQ